MVFTNSSARRTTKALLGLLIAVAATSGACGDDDENGPVEPGPRLQEGSDAGDATTSSTTTITP